MKKKLVFASVIIVLLVIVGVIFVIEKDNDLVLDEVKLVEYTDNSSGLFAIMVENGSGTGSYSEYTGDSFPTDMVFNSSLSNCISNSGETLTDVLTYSVSTNTAVVDVYETSYCYLYFDYLCSVNEDILSCLIDSASVNGGNDDSLILHEAGCDNGCAEDGHYRYAGGGSLSDNEVNNYICYGTDDLDECLADPDTYLFRILEIDPDTGYIKLIKNTILIGNENYSTYSGVYTESSYSSGYDYTFYVTYTTLEDDLSVTYFNTFANEWQDYIVQDALWSTGYELFSDMKSAYDYEQDTLNDEYIIALMNLSDYIYSVDISLWDDCSSVYTWSHSNKTNNWSWLYNYDITGSLISIDSSSAVEKILAGDPAISLYSGYVDTDPDFYLGSSSKLDTFIRPVFYIYGDFLIYVSGNGTESNPIIVTY